MKIVALKNFIKNVPLGKKDTAMNEIIEFQNQFEINNYDTRSIPIGYSVRKISHNRNNLAIYKFRVNRSDRVLFTYMNELNNFISKESFDTVIIFLDYCSHDKQIIRGKQINVLNYKEFYLLSENDWDEAIDNEYKDFEYNPNDVISRVLTIQEMATMLDNDEKKAVYYLNDEQFDCIRDDIKPLFLFGGAGSGKTTVSIYKCIILCRQYDRIGYFTYSQKLVDESQKIFGAICEQENLYSEYETKVGFNQLNTYIKNLLSIPSYIEYPEFKVWFFNSIATLSAYKKYKFEPLMVWREIRGILKGLFWVDCIKYEHNQESLSDETVSFLCKKNYATLSDGYLTIKYDNLFKIDISRESNLKNINLIRNDINNIFAEIERKIFSTKMLSLSDYLSLPASYSLFDKDEKRLIYKIALSYERYKETHSLLDENDLVCMAFINGHGFDQFDYLITDEVQDLTEKQIYYLYKLSKNPTNILFSGDTNQTVSPTFFDEGRISAIFMFRYGFNGFIKRSIESNYRNPLNIVKFSQRLFDLKLEKLNRHLSVYKEKSLRKKSGNVFFLSESDSNRTRLLDSIVARHYVSLIVVDEEAKKNLKNIIKDISVYTVSEIKGLENDYIVCYNILSTFYRFWSDIFANKAENTYLYLYIFNVLYVSITRAKENVCFYEENLPDEFIAYFSETITNVYNFNERTLLLEKKSTENEFLSEGRRMEKEGYYEQAINSYIKGGLSENNIEILRCHALNKNKEGFRIEAANMLMDINEYLLAAECFKEGNDFTNALMALVYANYPYDNIVKFFEALHIDPIEIVTKNEAVWDYAFYNIYHDYIKAKLDIYRQLNLDSRSMLVKVKEDLIKKKQGGKFI